MILVYLLLLLFVEVMVSTEFAAYAGGMVVFFEIIATFLAGIAILANFRSTIVEQVNNFAFGKISQEELLSKGAFTLVGAILLILPGIVTDVVGLLMQFNAFAALAAKLLFRGRVRMDVSGGQFHTKREEHDYIDVEVVDDEDHRRDTTLKR